MTAIISLTAIAAIALLLWKLVRVIVGDGYGHRPAPPSHHSDAEPGSPLWWVDAHSTGINWPHSEARRDLVRRLQPRH
jgi:hypothetical protein